MATPGELAAAAAKRFWYARIVLRSIPVTRSISRWLAPASSKVQTVVCRCGFKTFTPLPSPGEGAQSNRPAWQPWPPARSPDAARQDAVARVEEFTWTSVGEFGRPPGLKELGTAKAQEEGDVVDESRIELGVGEQPDPEARFLAERSGGPELELVVCPLLLQQRTRLDLVDRWLIDARPVAKTQNG